MSAKTSLGFETISRNGDESAQKYFRTSDFHSLIPSLGNEFLLSHSSVMAAQPPENFPVGLVATDNGF